MAKGLLAILAAAPKGKGGPEGPPEPDADDAAASSGSEDAFAKEAFSALQDGDEAGFTAAIKGVVKACLRSQSKGTY